MSLFGDGTDRQRIADELSYIFNEHYDTGNEAADTLKFVCDVCSVLYYMYGEW